MNKTIFKVGDKVNYYPYGDRVFELVGGKELEFPLKINIDGYTCRTFRVDGREYEKHTVPSLTLVERKPEKEEWYRVFYKNKDSSRPKNSDQLYRSKKDFLMTLGREESYFDFIILKKVNMESDL